MSLEKPAVVAQTVVEAVSEDIVALPATKTSVLGRTKEQYANMEPHQKRDFWLAVTSTFGGVALMASAFIVEKANPESKLPTYIRSAGYICDLADGYFAKRTATDTNSGAGTEFGAIADPLADKANNTINEYALVKKGRLRKSDMAIRAVRDVGVTVARQYVTSTTNGDVDVRATKFGKLNTVVRDGVNLFASTKIAERHPKANRSIQLAANAYSIASGAYTVSKLASDYRAKKRA